MALAFPTCIYLSISDSTFNNSGMSIPAIPSNFCTLIETLYSRAITHSTFFDLTGTSNTNCTSSFIRNGFNVSLNITDSLFDSISLKSGLSFLNLEDDSTLILENTNFSHFYNT